MFLSMSGAFAHMVYTKSKVIQWLKEPSEVVKKYSGELVKEINCSFTFKITNLKKQKQKNRVTK